MSNLMKMDIDTAEILLDRDAKTIVIRNLVIKNDDLFSFLEEHNDAEEAVRKALIVGALGIRSMGTGVKMDYVDKKFAEFMADVKQQFAEQRANVESLITKTFNEKDSDSPMYKFIASLENYFNDDTGVVRNMIKSTFNPNDKSSPLGSMMDSIDLYFSDSGKVRQVLDNHFSLKNKESTMSKFEEMLTNNFDVDKGSIKKLLDSTNPNSPVYLLKEDLMKSINEVRNSVLVAKAGQEVLEKSTQKGGMFEEVVYEQLHDVTRPFRDVVEACGTVTGLTGKTGDFIVSCNDDRIVVEAKDAGNYTIPKTLGEIREAIENRKASFGIFVFKSIDQMPKALQPCKVERNCIITSLDGGGLYYAYHLAKTILESERSNAQGQIPVDKIQSEVEHLMKKTLVIDEAIKKAGRITEHVDSIQSTLRVLQSEMDDSLRRIQSIIRAN